MKRMKRQGTKHPEALLLSMLATILIIAGFQVYWLKDNYIRAKEVLGVRANSLFHETVRQVQDSLIHQKLLLVLEDSSATAGLKRKSLNQPYKTPLPDPLQPARILKLLGKKLLNDSLDKKGDRKKEVNISYNENAKYNARDNTGKFHVNVDSLNRDDISEIFLVDTRDKVPGQNMTGDILKMDGKPRNKMLSISETVDGDSNHTSRINTIYINNEKGIGYRIKIDSLFNDSIPLPVLEAAVANVFKQEKLELPFIILRQPEEMNSEEEFIRRPMFGSFGGYKLQLGNTFPYLIKEILLPILFSFFLVGITIFSFIILYRSLLRQYRLGQIKNDLISNITHELKTPIATVGVAIEALKNFNAIKDPQRTKEYLDISQNELQRLGLLVDKVLNLSMFEKKEIEVKHEVFDLKESVNEVVASLRLQIEKYNARVLISSEGNTKLKGDRLHLVSVIFNLLDNALKYSKENAAIQIMLKEEAEYIVMKVKDNGIGVPAAYKEKIFEKFFRVPAGDTHNAKGHGLGLSYISQVVRQHKGSIEVDSQEGIGSTFTISLPKSQPPSPKGALYE